LARGSATNSGYVNEDADDLPVAAEVFARLAARTHTFQIRHDAPDEVCYEFTWAN